MKINLFIKQKLTNIFTAQMQKIISKHNPKIVAVAGSVGKTTTKLAIATVLSKGFRVQYQDGNYNTPISIPFIFTGQVMPSLHNPFSWFRAWLKGQKVLKKPYLYDVVVVELGIDAPGDMQAFSKTLHPNISVLTAVCEEHMEFFKTLDAVAKEELLIADFSSLFIFNEEDVAKKYLDKYTNSGSSVKSYGITNGQYTIKSIQKNDSFYIDTETSKGKINNAKIKSLVPTNLKSIAAAVAVADTLGLDNSQIKKGISLIDAIAGRMQMLNGIKNSLIIDDSYNSSPLAAEAALECLFAIKGKPNMQKIAILGSMNELGRYSKEAHQRVGDYCSPQKMDLLITIGKQANDYLAPIAGNKGLRVIKCNSPYQAANVALKELKDGAAILAKGSQNRVFAEEAIKPLLANPDDVSKLVRQSSFWLKKKQAQFKDSA
ncbi:MAG: Mur ligase family protein [Candidatus Saccharibacteria bacterium]